MSSTWAENGYGFVVRRAVWNSEKDNPGYEWTPYMSLENIVKFLSNHKTMLKEGELKVLECLSKAQNGESQLLGYWITEHGNVISILSSISLSLVALM